MCALPTDCDQTLSLSVSVKDDSQPTGHAFLILIMNVHVISTTTGSAIRIFEGSAHSRWYWIVRAALSESDRNKLLSRKLWQVASLISFLCQVVWMCFAPVVLKVERDFAEALHHGLASCSFFFLLTCTITRVLRQENTFWSTKWPWLVALGESPAIQRIPSLAGLCALELWLVSLQLQIPPDTPAWA